MQSFYDLRTESQVTRPSGSNGYFGEARWHSHPPREKLRSQPSEKQPQTLAGILANRGSDALLRQSLWSLLRDAKNAPDKSVEAREYAHNLLDKLENIADVMRDIGFRLPSSGSKQYADDNDSGETVEYSQLQVNNARSNVTVDLARAQSRRRVPLGSRGQSLDKGDAYSQFVRSAKKHQIDGVISQLSCVMGKIKQMTTIDEAHQRAVTAFEEDEVYTASKGRESAPRLVIHENRVASGKNMHGEQRYWPSVDTDPFFRERDPVHNWGIHIPSGVFVCCGERVASLHPGCLIDRFSATDNQSKPARFAQRRYGDGMTGQQWKASYTRGTAYLDEQWYEGVHNQIVAALDRIDPARLDAAFSALTVQDAFAALGANTLSSLVVLFRRVFRYNAYRKQGVDVPTSSLEWARFLAGEVLGQQLPYSIKEPVPPTGTAPDIMFDQRVIDAIIASRIPLVAAVPVVPGPAPVVVAPGPVVPVVVAPAPVAPVPGPPPVVVPVAPVPGPAPVVVPAVPGPAPVVVAPAPVVPVPGPGPAVVPGPGPAPVLSAAEIAIVEDTVDNTTQFKSEVTDIRKDAEARFATNPLVALRDTVDAMRLAETELQVLINASARLAADMEDGINKGILDAAGLSLLSRQAEQNLRSAMEKRKEVDALVIEENNFRQFLINVRASAADTGRKLKDAAANASKPELQGPFATQLLRDVAQLEADVQATVALADQPGSANPVSEQRVRDQLAAHSDAADAILQRSVNLKPSVPIVVNPGGNNNNAPAPGPGKAVVAVKPEPPSTPVSGKGAKSSAGIVVTPSKTPKKVVVKIEEAISGNAIQPTGIALLNRAKSILAQLDAEGPIEIPTQDGKGTETVNLWTNGGKDLLFRFVNQEAIQQLTFLLVGNPVKTEGSGVAARNYQALVDSKKFSLNANQRKYLFEGGGDDAPARQILLLRSFNGRRAVIVKNWKVLDQAPAFSQPEGHAYQPKEPDEEAEEAIAIFRGKDDKGEFRQRLGLLGRAWANFVAILLQITSEPLVSTPVRSFKAAADANPKIAEARQNINAGVDAATGFIVLQKMDAATRNLDPAYAVPAINAVDAQLIAAEEAFLLGSNIADIAAFPEQALIEQLAGSGAVRPEELAVFARLRSNKKNDIRAIATRMKDFERNQLYVSDYDKDGVPLKLDLERILINLLSEFFAYVAQNSALFSRDQLKALRLANENGQLYRSISADMESETIFDVAEMTVQEQIDLIHSWARVANVIAMVQDPTVDSARVEEAIKALFAPSSSSSSSSDSAVDSGIGSWFNWA